MTKYDYDYFVIGGGSGGVRSARIAAAHGARTALAEERYLGGTCVNVGCVPKKLMVYASHFAQDFADAGGYGWTVDAARHDWATLIANKDREIARLNAAYRRNLEAPGVTIYEQRARLADPHTVELADGKRVTAARILIATGGWPELPDQPGAREYGISSNAFFHLPEMPKRVVIAGGGYIAVEFAGILSGLGAEVTQLYRRDLFLRGFDIDVRTALAEELPRHGIDLRFNTVIDRIEKTGDGLAAHLNSGEVLPADQVIYAIGRRPLTAGLGLEEAGVALAENGAVKVNDAYQSSVPHIYAVGDVIDRVALTPVAINEGHALADTLFGGNPRAISYRNIPSAVFSQPPVASVGLPEHEARRQYGTVDLYRTRFRPMKATLAGRDTETMIKIIVDRASQRVIGCHMVGEDGPEIIQGVAIALNLGATKADFDRTIGLHPTVAEELVTLRTKVPDPVEAAA